MKPQLEFTHRSVPLALLLVCILAYGLQVFGLGFYWDDWPWAWLSHLSGPRGMLEIDALHRPLSGVILWFGALLAGESPLGWQIVNLAFRWLSAAAAFWALRVLWPGQAGRVAWISLLLLAYPGFTQQFVAVNSSRHVLPMAFFFTSLGFMMMGIRQPARYGLYTGVSLCLGLLAMLSTEYYYGLEFIRPVVIWFALDGEQRSARGRLGRTLRCWIAFIGLLAAVFAWRYRVSQAVNYPVTLTRDLSSHPLDTLAQSAKIVLNDFYVVTAAAWSQVIEFPRRADYGLRNLFLYWAVVAGSAAALFVYLSRLKDGPPEGKFWKQAVVLGVFSSLVAGLPFLATGIPVGLNFPADRTLLPFMFGASLLIAGLVDGLLRWKTLKLLLICLGVGLAAGFYLLTSVSYARDWDAQQAFFRQLVARAPGLQPDTALYYIYNISLRNFRSTDNSLSAPLNWIYAPQLASDRLPYIIYDLRLRADHRLPAMQAGLAIEDAYGDFEFSGSTDDLLLIHYAPPACLRVLHPRYDQDNPMLPGELKAILPLTNLDTIVPAPDALAALPSEVFGREPEASWCEYFQQADLARQLGDWAEAARIGELALQLSGAPRNETELAPFIQGYAHVGQWQQAGALTLEALQGNARLAPMLCSLWQELAHSTPDCAEKLAALDAMRGSLGCSVR
ncbi:MAG: hypothetical protein JXA78_16955 [Anaerolineales bacterium]|nr:hypothetical protein [Anaerolineales bacterium]